MKIRRYILVGLLLLQSAGSANACVPINAPTIEEVPSLVGQANEVFIGLVKSTASQKIILSPQHIVFKVIKDFKNSRDGEDYSVTTGQWGISCMKAKVGQLWLYVRYPDQLKPAGAFPVPGGTDPPQSGSLLRSQYGEYTANTVSRLKEKLGFDVLSVKLPMVYGPPTSIYTALKRQEYEAQPAKGEFRNPFTRP